METARALGQASFEANQFRISCDDRRDCAFAAGVAWRGTLYEPIFDVGADRWLRSVFSGMEVPSGDYVSSGLLDFDDSDPYHHLQSNHVSIATPGFPIRHFLASIDQRSGLA